MELSNMPSPNGLTARTLRRLAKKNKLNKQKIIYSPDSKSRIPTSLTTHLGYTSDEQ